MWDWAASFNLAVVWAVSMFWSAISIGSFPKKTVRFASVVIYSPPPRFSLPVWNMREGEAKYRRHVNQMFAATRRVHRGQQEEAVQLFDPTRQKWSRGDAIRLGGTASLSWMDIRSNSGEIPRSSAVGQGNGCEDLRPHRLIRLSQAFAQDLTCIAG